MADVAATRIEAPVKPRRRRMSKLARQEALAGYLFLLPNLLGFAIFNVFPILAAFYLMFTDYNLTWPPNWVGFGNFVAMADDWLFWRAMRNTLYWVLGTVVPRLVLALGLATLINRKMRGVLAFRLIYFLPNITLGVAASIIWMWVYHPQYGLLNWMLLVLFGVKDGPQWLFDSQLAMPALILVAWWRGMGYSMLVLLAALQSVPQELYEAAIVDGANSWQQFRYVTLPMLSPAIFFLVTTGIIGAFQAFDVFYLMTAGGPAHATTTMVLNIFNNGFRYFKMGYASAMAMVLFGCIMVVTLIQWRGAKSWVFGFTD